MRIALIGNTESHESIRLKEEATKRGHDMDLLSFSEMTFYVQKTETNITTKKGSVIDNYDLFIFRGINSDRGEAQVMARWLQKKGKIVVERKLSDGRYVMTKLPYTLAEHGVDVVPTILKWELDEPFLKSVKYPVLIRKTTGSKGKGILLAKNKEELLRGFKSIGPKVLIQPYFKADHDFRVIIINGKVIGCMKKTKQDGSITSNISSGGIPANAILPDKVLKSCVDAATASRVDIAGVDVMEDGGTYYILEVNSMPQFKGFEESTGVNIGKEIILCMERLFFETEDGKSYLKLKSNWYWAITKDGEKWLHEDKSTEKIKTPEEKFFVDEKGKSYILSEIEIKYLVKSKIKIPT